MFVNLVFELDNLLKDRDVGRDDQDIRVANNGCDLFADVFEGGRVDVCDGDFEAESVVCSEVGK